MKLSYQIERFFMRVSYKRNFDGLWIGVIGGKSEAGLVSRVEDALKLIQQHDPLRYHRILRDVDRIWIHTLLGVRGQFSFYFNRCSLDDRFVKSESIEKIASTIVHEATHGYPCLRKVGYPEPLRHRIEAICMKQQLVFAQKIPVDSEIREEVERSLTRPPSFWSDEELQKYRSDHAREAFKHIGIQDWVVNSLTWIISIARRIKWEKTD